MDFLLQNLPESDIDSYPEELFRRFADHGMFLRRTVPWCAALDLEIFGHYVLFPRVNDEDLTFDRRMFYDALWPRIQGLDEVGRVLEVNRWCHEIASYEAQDPRTASPATVYRCGSGRCGEESAFLVAALRSVGIPARQVYVPRWAHCDDNHAWVEALCGGVWRFFGACEPEPVPDRGWFNTAASRAVLVHSRIFGVGRSPLHGELIGVEGGVSWYNQTARYAPTELRTVRAVHNGAPAAGAVFRLQVLNEAGFRTIATVTAGEDGSARIRLGLGDVHVQAAWRGLLGEGDCGPEGLTVELGPPETGDTGWVSRDYRAAEASAVNPTPLDPAQRAARAAVLSEGSRLRQARLDSLRLRLRPEWDPLLLAARGNAGVIAGFLTAGDDPRREALVRSLTEKDLRDVTLETLEDHLRHTPPAGDMPPEIYVRYLLCPRIELEKLTPWRGPLGEVSRGLTPQELWLKLRAGMDTGVERTYSNLLWTPLAAARSGRCDIRSLRVLYAACLRAGGVPARLSPVDGLPEYWREGGFRPLEPEDTGRLRITGEALAYGRDWTLSRLEAEGWQVLDLPPDVRDAALPAGRYRVVTSARLPNGNQFANIRELDVPAGGTVDVEPVLRRYSLGDMLGCQRLPVIPAVTPEGREVPDICRLGGRASLLCWVEPGTEPTEHLLNELISGAEALNGLGVRVALMAPGRECLGHAGLSRAAEALRDSLVLLGDWAYYRELAARELGCDPSETPLTVVCGGDGRAVYAAAGYRVGAVPLLTGIAGYILEHEREDMR